MSPFFLLLLCACSPRGHRHPAGVRQSSSPPLCQTPGPQGSSWSPSLLTHSQHLRPAHRCPQPPPCAVHTSAKPSPASSQGFIYNSALNVSLVTSKPPVAPRVPKRKSSLLVLPTERPHPAPCFSSCLPCTPLPSPCALVTPECLQTLPLPACLRPPGLYSLPLPLPAVTFLPF